MGKLGQFSAILFPYFFRIKFLVLLLVLTIPGQANNSARFFSFSFSLKGIIDTSITSVEEMIEQNEEDQVEVQIDTTMVSSPSVEELSEELYVDEEDVWLGPLKRPDSLAPSYDYSVLNVTWRKIPIEEIKKLQRDKEYAYANDSAYFVKEKKTKKKSDFNWENVYIFFKYASLVIIVGLIVFILIRYASSFMAPSNKKSPVIFSGEEAVDETSKTSLQAAWKQAEVNQAWRLAFRYRFLFLLQTMNDRNQIQVAKDLPLGRYVQQLKKNLESNGISTSSNTLFQSFRNQVRAFEYIWYGEMEVAPAVYEQLIAEQSFILQNGGKS
jgi:hypothetical protein